MYQLKQSQTARNLVFLMVSSTDHVTAVTGITPTVTLSKNGAAFGSPAGAVTEIANGWYKVAGNATDTNTLGPLALHATGTGADPVDALYTVVAFDPDDAVRYGLSALPNAAAEASGGLVTRGTGTGQITVSSGQVTVGTNNDKTGYTASTVSDKTGYSLSTAGVQAIWDALTSALTTAGSIGKRLADNVDAAVSTRSSHSAADVWAVGTRTLTGFGTLVADIWANATRTLSAGTNIVLAKGTGVTGFNDLDAAGVRGAVGLASANLDTQLGAIDDYIDTEVAAIKAKTDLIPASPAATGDIPTAAAIADQVWDEALAGHLTTGSTGAALNGAGGSAAGAGSVTFTYTVYESDGTTPLDGCEVYVTTDSGGANVVAGTLTTDAFGQVVFQLDPGTYFFFRKKSGWNFVNPDQETVS